ncbi:MAG: alpha/beta hydrolase [Myxococcota bacterium]|nr:alpha/beta hydrolase [Myxococcota bacterium]
MRKTHTSNPEKNTILLFHGSPGGPKDFLHIKEGLKDYHFRDVIRPGYETFQTGNSQIGAPTLPSPTILMGYSWGAVAALRTADLNLEQTSAIILAAPILFPNPQGLFRKLILNAPFVSDIIIRRKSPAILDEFIKQTCFPAPCPEGYRDWLEEITVPDILKQCVKEKIEIALDIPAILSRINLQEIPVFVIWGDQDQSVHEIEQIRPIRSRLSNLQEAKLHGAGHALMWTHHQEVQKSIALFLETLTVRN